jgi:large-conductance mechanosensitive channel
MLNCHASIKGLFVGMVVFSCTMVSIIIYAVFRHKIDDNHVNLTNTSRISYRQNSISKISYSIAILELFNLFLLALSLFATIWSLIKIRKLDYRRTTTGE